MKLRDLVARIRLVLDKREAESAEQEVSGSFDRMGAAVKKVGVFIAAAFAVSRLKDFASAAVQAAVESDRVWNRLAGTLRNAGVSFDVVQGEIEAAARAMAEFTTLGDEDFASVLQELVIITGDYEASMRNVGLVADLAAGKQIDLGTAAELVGKVMAGETGTLKRYGIVVEEGADAIEVMRQRFAGLAQNEANTLGGKIERLTETWDEFKETVGTVLLNLGEGAGAIDLLTSALWRAIDAMQTLERIVISARLGAALARRNPEAIRNATEDMARLEAAVQRRQQGALRSDPNALPGGPTKFVDSPDTIAERQKAAAEARIKAAEAEQELLDSIQFEGQTDVRGDGFELERGGTGIILRDLDLIPAKIETTTSAFQSMFRLITIDGETAQETLTSLGIALATDGLEGMSRLASAKAQENIARAVEEAAQGFGAIARGNPGAALHFKAAAEHTASAGLWKLLGGAVGGGGTRTSGSAGYASSSRDLGGSAARQSDVRVPMTLHITMDPLNPTDVRFQRVVKGAADYAAERYGDVQIVVNGTPVRR